MKVNKLPRELEHLPVEIKTEIVRSPLDSALSYYKFEMRWKGAEVITGSEFRPSPMSKIDYKDPDLLTEKGLNNLLGFLTCGPGDVSREFFDIYNSVDMTFITSRDMEELKQAVIELEERLEEKKR